MNKKELLYIGSAILSVVFWSFSFVWAKIAYIAYQPITVVFFRLIISALILFIFSKAIRKLQTPSKKDMWLLLLCAFFEPFLYFMGESFGLLYVSSTVAAVIVATIPLLSPIAAWYFYKEKLTRTNLFGLVVSFAGVSIVVFNPAVGFTASPKGIALEFLAVFAAIAYTIVLKNLLHRYNSFTIIAYQNLFGLIMFLPFWLIFDYNKFAQTPFHLEAFTAIMLLAFFASTLAFIFFTYSVKKIGINRSNMFINLIPVLVAVIAFFVLGDKLSLQKMIGIGIVIGGLFLAQLKRRRWFNA